MPVTDADIDLYYPGVGGKSGQDRRYWENYLLKLLRADIAAGGGAPVGAQYITSTADATLTAERVLTDTATVTWDFSTPGQAKASAVGSAPAFTTVEVSLGSSPKLSGSFTIAGAGLTIGKPVFIQQAVGPYTGKGTLADEAEMDQVCVTASVTSAVLITAYWTSPTFVTGNFKFNYLIGA